MIIGVPSALGIHAAIEGETGESSHRVARAVGKVHVQNIRSSFLERRSDRLRNSVGSGIGNGLLRILVTDNVCNGETKGAFSIVCVRQCQLVVEQLIRDHGTTRSTGEEGILDDDDPDFNLVALDTRVVEVLQIAMPVVAAAVLLDGIHSILAILDMVDIDRFHLLREGLCAATLVCLRGREQQC